MGSKNVFNFNLKAVINKEKTRVLFAEVENDFVDVLFSFLILPIGNILQILEKHYGDKMPVIGSLNTLYNSLSNLHAFNFQLYGIKPSVLNPESAYAFPFLNLSEICLSDKAYFVVHRIFTEKNASFIICDDDLRIVPNGYRSILHTLNSAGVDISDIDGAETRNVTFGLNEIMDFLKGLLLSPQPLTNIILGRTTLKYETNILFHQNNFDEATKTCVLKVMFQKLTKKLLFAQADKDFASYIFNVLACPLGLLDLTMGGILYRSIVDLVDHKYLNGTDSKDCLMKSETFSYPFFENVVSKFLDTEGSRMYMVTDDLTVTRLCVSSTISLLGQMKISLSDVEEVELHIGVEEVSNIWIASVTSSSALTDSLINPESRSKNIDFDP